MRNEFFKRYGFRILLVIVFLLPFVWMGTKRTLMSNSNNVADWLPNYYEETQQYNWFLKNFPFERFVVVSWKGCNMDDSRLEMFAQKLVPGQTIDNIGHWAEMETLKAELAADDGSDPPTDPGREKEETPALRVADATQPEYKGYFKSVVTGPRLFRMLKDRYGQEGAGGTALTDEQIFKKLEGTLIGPDGYSTALIVTLTKEAPQGKDLAKVLEAIREIGRECGVQPPKKVDNRPLVAKIFGGITGTIGEIINGRHPDMSGVIIGGPPVDNVAITYEGEHTLRRLAGICGLVGLALAWLCFRDLRLTSFIFWVAILSAGVSLACVKLTGGTCDAILLSMPALIYVLAMSGAVHLINYYHDAIREGGLDQAPERAIGHGWYPCFFANFTTALGLLSLYSSHLVPITKFGVYSALGVMLQLAILFYYLPTLLYFYPSKKVAATQTVEDEHNSFMQKFWRVWGGLMIRNSVTVTVLCFGVMIFFTYGLVQIKTSVKMMRFFSQDSEIIHHYTWLEEHLGPLVPMEIVVKFDNEKCKFSTLDRLRLIEDINNELRTKLKDDIGGVISAETALPVIPRSPAGRKSARQISYERAANFLIDKNRPEMKDYMVIEGERSLKSTDPDFAKTLAELDITPDAAARLVRAGFDTTKKLRAFPEGQPVAGIEPEEMKIFRDKAVQWEKNHGLDLWRISIRVWSLKKDIDYALFIRDVKEIVDPMIDRFLAERFPDADYPKHPIPEDPSKKTGYDSFKEWCSTSLVSCFGIIPLSQEKTEVYPYPVDTVYTGMVPVVFKTQHELLGGLRDSFLSSFIMIAITMAFILKSPLAGFCAMIPNVFPTVVVFGFMGQFGYLVDVGTMMTASVALGISVDDTIHFLTWFRDGIDKGMTRKEATRFAYSRCATSMFQTTLIAGLGLSAFALSTFTPTQMFGIMMLAILTAALMGDLIFLAAMLNTPIGIVFEPRRNKKKPDAGPDHREPEKNRDTLLLPEHRLDTPQAFPPPSQRKKDSLKAFSDV